MGKNLQKFNRVSATVLSYLYNRFPAKSQFNPTKLINECDDFVDHCMTWLADEGLIRFSEVQSGMYIDCALTMNGLAVLEGADSVGQTVIQKIKACQSNHCFNCLVLPPDRELDCSYTHPEQLDQFEQG